jgi:lipoprotein signal peptidase
MAERSYRWLLILIAVAGLSIDQASKYGVFRWLYRGGEFQDVNGNSFEIVPGWFKLIAQFDAERPFCDCGFSTLQSWSAPVMPRVNHGALFGMGAQQKGTANWFFAGVSLFAAVAILVWGTRQGPNREKWLSIALGLILGGTIGNLYDRVVFGGVRDFLYFYYIEWPVFNFADCCLVVGAALLLLQAIFVSPHAEQPAKEPDPAAPTA